MEEIKLTTYEWLGLIVVLITGFWKLCDKLTKIEVRLSSKVDFDDCAQMRNACRCRQDVEKIKEQIEKLHPPQ